MAVDSDFQTPNHPTVPTTPLQVREEYPGAARSYGLGTTFMKSFDLDQHSNNRFENPYYPFASRQDWQLAYFLLSSGMSMKLINQFLRLELVSLPLDS